MRDFVTWMERRNLSPKTIRNYTRRIADIQDWLADHGYQQAPRCNWRQIRMYALTLPNTYASRSAMRSAIAAFYRFCGKHEPPIWAIPQPKREPGLYRGFATDVEKDRLLAAAKTMGEVPYAMCCALYYQGLRREEASQVRWDDVRNGNLIGTGKGNIEFERPLHEKFVRALETLTPTSPWVFPGRFPGTHVSPNTVWMAVRLAGERAGLGRVTPHQLRHTSTAVINDTVGLRAAAWFARHRTVQVTMIYTRTTLATQMEGYAAL